MEVVTHHPGLEVYERPPQSATQHSTTSSPPPMNATPHVPQQQQHQQAAPYDPYYKSASPSAMTYAGVGNGQLPPAPPSQYYSDSPELYQAREKKRRGWILPAAVGIIVAVLVGAAVGGGLGASLSNCESNLKQALLTSDGSASGESISSKSASGNTAATATASTVTKTLTAGTTQPTDSNGDVTDYAPVPPSQVGEVADTCSSVGSNVASTSYSDAYSVLCDVDFGSGPKGTGDDTVYIADLVGIVAYTYRDCMDACSSLSAFSTIWGTPTQCRAFTFRTGMAGSYDSFKSANCWLKNQTAPVGDIAGCNGCISGSLKS